MTRVMAFRPLLAVTLICGVAAGGEHLPAPISRQSADTIARWDEVNELVKQNDTLAKPLPEPGIVLQGW